MSKQKDRNELMRYGNFIIDGITNKDGHMAFIEVRTVSNNWKMRVDEGTFMFGLLKDASTHSKSNEDYKQMHNYIHATISVIYNFGTSGIPIDMLVDLNALLVKKYEAKIKPTGKEVTKEEQEILDGYKREYEMKEELKKAEEDGNKKN
jgi:hypothetical protein